MAIASHRGRRYVTPRIKQGGMELLADAIADARRFLDSDEQRAGFQRCANAIANAIHNDNPKFSFDIWNKATGAKD